MMRTFGRWMSLCGVMAAGLLMAGCGLGEGIHVARDEGKSTSRFRYEFEMVPQATVMLEDTQPRWQLGRYVFVRGVDDVLVVSRVTSWSDTATKKQRETGDIPGMKDQILERLWITIPEGTEVGQELDLHALTYRFLVSYDRGKIDDAQFAQPFHALGNVRVLEKKDDMVRLRLRVKLTTDQATAWEIGYDERELLVPVLPQGRRAKMAASDAVIYARSRAGERPTTGMTPVQITPQMTSTLDEHRAVQPDKTGAESQPLPSDGQGGSDSQTPPVLTPDDALPAKQGGESDGVGATGAAGGAASADEDSASVQAQATPMTDIDVEKTLPGRWYYRSQAWEVFLQLKEDGSFIHAASRPLGTPIVIRGTWRTSSGYLVLHIKNIMVGNVNQTAVRKDNPYGMLMLTWYDANTAVMDGDMPAPGPQVGGYRMLRAEYPDMDFIAPQSYRPEMPEPVYVGRPAAQKAESAKTEPGQAEQPAGEQQK